MNKRYIDGPFGQIHIRQWGSNTSRPPLICFAPSPFSSVAYASLAPILSKERVVIAMDYPGYGLSDPCPEAPLIADYATTAAALIAAVSPDQPADLLGFHTGCLVAAETSLLEPDLVNRLTLIDVPFFEPAKQAELLASTPEKAELKTEISGLSKAWDFCVSTRLEHISLPRTFDMFIDYISAGESSNAAFHAAFQYDCNTQFSKVSHPCWVLATDSSLHQASCKTADVVPGAELIELREIKVAVLEKGAAIIGEKLGELLS